MPEDSRRLPTLVSRTPREAREKTSFLFSCRNNKNKQLKTKRANLNGNLAPSCPMITILNTHNDIPREARGKINFQGEFVFDSCPKPRNFGSKGPIHRHWYAHCSIIFLFPVLLHNFPFPRVAHNFPFVFLFILAGKILQQNYSRKY